MAGEGGWLCKRHSNIPLFSIDMFAELGRVLCSLRNSPDSRIHLGKEVLTQDLCSGGNRWRRGTLQRRRYRLAKKKADSRKGTERDYL